MPIITIMTATAIITTITATTTTTAAITIVIMTAITIMAMAMAITITMTTTIERLRRLRHTSEGTMTKDHARACTCETCQSMCEHTPCWPTPREAERLIRKGYARSLMLGRDDAKARSTAVVSPAIAGGGGRAAPAVPKGTCVFFTADRRCALHELGLKPMEGRLAMCPGAAHAAPPDLHRRIARLWDTRRGRRAVALWQAALAADAQRKLVASHGLPQRLARAAVWMAGALFAAFAGGPAWASNAQSGTDYPIEHGATDQNGYPIEHGQTNYPIEHGATDQNGYPIEHGHTKHNAYPIEHGQTQYPIEHGAPSQDNGGQNGGQGVNF